MKAIIISGRSGSGKSSILQVLEDLQYYCIDNLPLKLLPDLQEQLKEQNVPTAISVDARNFSGKKDVDSIEAFKKKHRCPLVYIDADTDSIIKRFKETRRKHPLTDDATSLKEALQADKVLLQPIANLADLKIDTTGMNVKDLRKLVLTQLHDKAENQLSLLFQSFGFKNGVPIDADFVFDVRCLPNPFWEKSLRGLTGLDQGVIDFLSRDQQSMTMIEDIKHFLNKWLSAFKAEQRQYLNVAIGCTGGQHRSVFITEQLARHFQDIHATVSHRHRDL